MEKNEVSKTAGQAVNSKHYINSGYEREIAINRSEEIARKVYELSLIEEFEPLKSWEDSYEISRKYPIKFEKSKVNTF